MADVSGEDGLSPYRFDVSVKSRVRATGERKLHRWLDRVIDDEGNKFRPHKIAYARDAPLTHPTARKIADAYIEMFHDGALPVTPEQPTPNGSPDTA